VRLRDSIIKLEKKYAPALDNYGRSACPQDFDFHQIFDNDR
jgi:hypothetical protein